MNTNNTKGALVALAEKCGAYVAKRPDGTYFVQMSNWNFEKFTEAFATALQAHSPPAPAVASETAAGAAERLIAETVGVWREYDRDDVLKVVRAALSATPPAGASETAAGAVSDALEAVDVLYDLMLQEATVGQRIDAKIALKRAILALATPPAATKVPSDEQIRKVYRDACEHADECQHGFSYGRMQALRAVFDLGRAALRSPAAHGATTRETVDLTHQSVPIEPTEALLRAFYECPPDELRLAWAAMIKVAQAAARKVTPPSAQQEGAV